MVQEWLIGPASAAADDLTDWIEASIHPARVNVANLS